MRGSRPVAESRNNSSYPQPMQKLVDQNVVLYRRSPDASLTSPPAADESIPSSSGNEKRRERNGYSAWSSCWHTPQRVSLGSRNGERWRHTKLVISLPSFQSVPTELNRQITDVPEDRVDVPQLFPERQTGIYNTRYLQQNVRAQDDCLNAVLSTAKCLRLSTGMLATSSQSDWMSCVQHDSGLFSWSPRTSSRQRLVGSRRRACPTHRWRFRRVTQKKRSGW